MIDAYNMKAAMIYIDVLVRSLTIMFNSLPDSYSFIH